MKEAEVAGMKVAEVVAEVVATGMKVVEVASMKVAEVVATGMKAAEVAAAEVMVGAVDGWVAAQGVAATRHIDLELVFFALAKCLPLLSRYYIQILFWNSEIMACVLLQGFEALIWFFFIML